jgi:catechol 2,3-dioxygenase-like lactoylglutathione lyase family enzyme
MKLGPIIPVLRMFDIRKAKEFYVDFLGFKVDWEHRFEPELPLYMQVSRGDCLLHISEHHGDAAPGAAVRIMVDDVYGLCAELSGRQYGYARPGVQVMPWKLHEMTVIDPFANRLIFFDARFGSDGQATDAQD